MSLKWLMIGAMSAACQGSGAEWKPVTCPEVERGAKGRFEAIRQLDDFERGIGNWEAHRDGQNAESKVSLADDERHAGRSSLRVDCRFVAGKQHDYVALSMGHAIPAAGEGLGLWIKKGDLPVHANVRLSDKSGEIHQFSLSVPSGAGWTFIAGNFDGDGPAWGGDGNKKLDYPCKLDSLIIDRDSTDFGGSGSIWIDDVAIVRPRKPRSDLRIEVEGGPLGNLFAPGQEVRIRASAGRGEIRWVALDWRGEAVGKGSGAADGTEVRVPGAGRGYFACRFSLFHDGAVVEERDFHGARLPEDAPRNDFVGACVHFMRRDAWPIEGLGLMPRLGITQVRDDFTWGVAERKAGEIGMPAPQLEAIDRGIALGIRWLGILCYANPNYDNNGFPNSPGAVAAYARYGATIARQLDGKVNWFEIWNEWSGGCGMHDRGGDHGPEAYARLIRAAYPAIKQASPKAQIIGLGGEHSRHHFDQIGGMFRSGAAGAMDAWSVHPYRYPRGPEESDLMGELDKVGDLGVENGAPRRAWITEIGWPTHVAARGIDAASQARMAVRSLALMQSSGFVEKVFWYDFKDDGLDPTYNEDNFGIVRHQKFNFAPKPAAAAIAAFSGLTAGAKPAGCTQNDGVFAVRYEMADGRRLCVAWSPEGGGRFEFPGKITSVVDLMGNLLDAGAMDRLGPDPIYVIGEP